MKRALLVAFVLSAFVVGCQDEEQVLVPDYRRDDILAATQQLPERSLDLLQGVYRVVEGKPLLGDEVVLHASGRTMSLFTGRDACHAIMEGGWRDSALIFTGYWRKQVNLETGVMAFRIEAAEGGADVLRGGAPVALQIRGFYGNAFGAGERALFLEYVRPLYAGAPDFLIIAHRAGGRNSDYLPASENSVELVRLAERYGANGVEIDVQLSKDGVPIVYHDEDLNERLTLKSGLVGSISDYTIAQLETFVRLKNGERIPTLRRMLATILRNTTLRFVWLDSKATVPIALLRDIQRAYADSAFAMGRTLDIVIGVPDEEKYEELLRVPSFADARVLCELDIDRVRTCKAEYWAPRWTLGTLNSEVAAMHAEQRKVLSWTLDDPVYMRRFLTEGYFDGILTNYPSVLAFQHFSR